jgi:hypothetical protein
MAYMKTLLTIVSFLTAILLFPGCYTILLVEDATESTFVESATTIVEYIPVYISEPDPGPVFGPPPPCPDLPTYIPTPVHVNDNPTSTPPQSSDNHREIHTGRSGPDSNPVPVRNDENSTGTRDSGPQRGRR